MKNLDKLAELATTLPAKIKAGAAELVSKMGEVVEGIGDNPIEWRPDSLKVVQGTSDRSKLPKSAVIGSIVIRDTVFEQPLTVIPLRAWKGRQYWDPDQNNSRVICSSQDTKVGFRFGNCSSCQYSKFDEENNKSQCNTTVTVMATTPELDKVFMVNFSKSNYSNGTAWMSLMSKNGVSTYKRQYTLTTETSKKSKNVEVLLAANDTTSAKDSLPFLQELFDQISANREESLAKFYDYVKSLTSATPMALPSHMELDESEVTTVQVLEPEVTAAVSGSSKYTM
jgi:hypothetical protein